MAQITRFTVGVTNNSSVVICSPNLLFTTPSELLGAGFKILNDPIVYTIASYIAPTVPVPYYTLNLSASFQGVTNALAQYQITTDYTPNLRLAEINVGDQDWPTHLTQETIRKIDSAFGALGGSGNGNVVTINATTGTVTATIAGSFSVVRVGSTIVSNGVSVKVTAKASDSSVTVTPTVNWYNGGVGYTWTYSIGTSMLNLPYSPWGGPGSSQAFNVGALTAAGGVIATLPVYVDNTAAAALATGTMYRTATGVVMIKY